jgi:hypothetical protein
MSSITSPECVKTLLLKGMHHCPGALSKYHGEEKMACVRVIIVPDDMNWDAETYLPTYLLSPLPADNKINCSLARNLSMHNIVPQMFFNTNASRSIPRSTY